MSCFVHVTDIHDRLVCQQMHVAQPVTPLLPVDGKVLRELFRPEGDPAPVQRNQPRLSASFSAVFALRSASANPLHCLQIFQEKLRLHHFDVTAWIHASVDMDNVGIVEATHDMRDGINFADMRKELVAQAFSLARPAHEPAMSTNSIVESWFSGMVDARQLSRRSSRTVTMPMLGSMVQKG